MVTVRQLDVDLNSAVRAGTKLLRRDFDLLGVWTNGGRRLLNRQVKASGRLTTLKDEIVAGKAVEIKHTTPKFADKTTPVLQA